MTNILNNDEIKYTFSWISNPDGYKHRAFITNFMKRHYDKSHNNLEWISKMSSVFQKLSKNVIKQVFLNDNDNYIRKAETFLMNCLKFDDLDGFQGLLVIIFLFNEDLIGKFWLYVFCGEPLSSQTPNTPQIQNLQPTPAYPSNQPNSLPYINNPPPNQLYYPNQIYGYNPNQYNQSYLPPQPYNPINNQNIQPFNSNLSQNPQTTLNSNPNQLIKAQNPDQCIESLCKILGKFSLEFSEDKENNSREFINFFISRFLQKGFEAAASKFNPSRLQRMCGPLKNYILVVSKCSCEWCSKSFIECCKAYQFFVKSSLEYTNNDELCNEVIDSLVELLSLESPFHLDNVIEILIVNIDAKYFKEKTKLILQRILNIGMALTGQVLCSNPSCLINCMKIINDIFSENYVCKIQDPELITQCIRFFYYNRFYEPFRGITQKLSNTNLIKNINVENLEDVILDAYLEEEEVNENINDLEPEIEHGNHEYKEFVKLFNEIRGRGKKKKNEQIIDNKLLEDNIIACINQAYNDNLQDIKAIAPIAAACKEAFQLYFRNQMAKHLNEQQSANQNQIPIQEQEQEQNQMRNVNIFLDITDKKSSLKK